MITIFDTSVLGMATVFRGSGRADRTAEIEAKTPIEFVRPIIAAVIADRPGNASAGLLEGDDGGPETSS